MKKVYFLNNYNKSYDTEAIFLNTSVSFGQYITYELFNMFGGNVVYEGKAFGEPQTGKIQVDLMDLCASQIEAVDLTSIPVNSLVNMNTYSIPFRLTVKVKDVKTDNVISTTTNEFRLIFADNKDNSNDSNYIGQYYIDQTYNNTTSNISLRYEIYNIDDKNRETLLFQTTNITSVLPQQVYMFKYLIKNKNIRIKKYNANTIIFDKVIKCDDRNITTYIYYLNSNGNYDVVPVIMDKSIYKRQYTEKTFVNKNKTIKYNSQFKDSLNFKTPYLSNNDYAKCADLINSNNVYLIGEDTNRVNVNIADFEFKTFKNTRSFNQFTGTVDLIINNKRYL